MDTGAWLSNPDFFNFIDYGETNGRKWQNLLGLETHDRLDRMHKSDW